ncbi:MAG: hypothetical protein MJ131_10900 [Lachnospiraceae bacterium]|nr:hypothetical protein [Lachnospiraceae bacterium]
MNIGAAFKAKGAWEKFAKNHPKFPLFMDAVKRKGVQEGTLVSVSFTDPDGSKLETNLRITAEDLELLEVLKGMM